MKDTGVVRKLDELGRITLPMEIRKNFNLNERDPLHIYVEGSKIILQKALPSDVFTGSEEDLIEYHGKLVSKQSVKELAEIAGFKLSE